MPEVPGVYRMLRRDGSVLYVGKATSLRARVNSYFRQHRRVPDRTLEMLTQAQDPPRVVAWLEQIAAHGAHELRRAAWLTRLGSSTVVWSRRDRSMRRVLVFDRGAIVHRGDLEPGAPLPSPPRWGHRTPIEPLFLDMAGFDRLRTLTAQLRRLVVEGRDVRLRCCPRVTLAVERLGRALSWV
ncbi:MAG: nucleotide excision repair endonuclease [Myxococcota bacterium]